MIAPCIKLHRSIHAIMRASPITLLNVKPGEWQLAVGLLVLLAINNTVLQLANVVATAGFVSQVGSQQILWLWVVDMVITLVASSVYALIVDRVSRRRLLEWIFLAFATAYVLLLLLFTFDAGRYLAFPLLYLLSDQQYYLFPLAFWALAGDIYTVSESKRLFPLIAAGAAVGNILGNGMAAGATVVSVADSQQTIIQLIIVGVITLLIGYGLVFWLFRVRQINARRVTSKRESVRETIKEGFSVIQNVPLFTFLAFAMILGGFALTIIEYHFIATLDTAFTDDPLAFQRFYGAYRAALVVVTLILQGLIAGRLLNRIPLKNTFTVFPAILAVASAIGQFIPGLIGAAGGRFIGWLIERAWNEPARRSLLGLVPDERRGRVGVFVEGYFYAFATIFACIFLGILFVLSTLNIIPAWHVPIIYMSFAAATSFGALWGAIRLRSFYEQSLLNWRLSRSRRKSVLDEIEF